MKTTCGIFLFDDTNEFLIVHPTNHTDNIWSIPKGMVNDNEDYLDAAIRELKEETSIDLKSMEYTILEDIPPFKYQHQDKQLKSFKIKIKGIIDVSKLRCDSMFNDKINNKLSPEVDDFKMVNENWLKTLNKTQQDAYTYSSNTIH